MKLLTALAALTLVGAPAQAFWIGDGTTETTTNRFTGSVTTTYSAKKGDCGVTKSVKSQIAWCKDITTDGDRSIMLTTSAKGWEVMTYRSIVDGKINVILTFDDTTTKTTQLPVVYSGDVLHGSTVAETVIIKAVPANVVSLEAQYGGGEYWYSPKK